MLLRLEAPADDPLPVIEFDAGRGVSPAQWSFRLRAAVSDGDLSRARPAAQPQDARGRQPILERGGACIGSIHTDVGVVQQR